MTGKKQEIIHTSISLFNAKGFHNVSIKDIADALRISPGNFTYHFNRKTDILAAIQQQMIEDSDIEIMPAGHITLYHFEQIFQTYSQIQAQYNFYYDNLQYIFEAFPAITKNFKRILIRRFKDARSLIQYYIETGRLRQEEKGINYNHYIRTIWLISVFWTANELMTRGLSRKDNPTVIDILWSGLIPYMTEKGYAEYLEILSYAHE